MVDFTASKNAGVERGFRLRENNEIRTYSSTFEWRSEDAETDEEVFSWREWLHRLIKSSLRLPILEFSSGLPRDGMIATDIIGHPFAVSLVNIYYENMEHPIRRSTDRPKISVHQDFHLNF